MRYTHSDIETTLYNRVKALKLGYKGAIYKLGMRPLNSQKEDCVVSVLNGTADQIQEGECVVNIYVPDILMKDGLYYRDSVRCGNIERVLSGVATRLNNNSEIQYKESGMIMTIQERAINQHFVSLKLRYKVLQ